MNKTDLKEYWRGYRAMKGLALAYWNADEAFRYFYNGNSSDAKVKGARRAYNYIKRVGLAHIKA